MDMSEVIICYLDLEWILFLLLGCFLRDWGFESWFIELFLEELSISVWQQFILFILVQLVFVFVIIIGIRVGGYFEELFFWFSCKRKFLEDMELGKIFLLDVYCVWQQGQKGVVYDFGCVERIMLEIYMFIKQVDEEVVLEQVVKFCQVYFGVVVQRQVLGDIFIILKYLKDS